MDNEGAHGTCKLLVIIGCVMSPSALYEREGAVNLTEEEVNEVRMAQALLLCFSESTLPFSTQDI